VRCLIRAIKQFATTSVLAFVFVQSAFLFSGVGQAAAQDQDQAPPQADQAPADQAPPADQSSDQASGTQGTYANLSRDQLDRLVAPIALYPDALVAQILGASTFPTQVVDAEDFLKSHPSLSAADLGAQVDQQPWDPSVKALVQYPSVLANLSSNLGWTSELGDAYYNQQQDVMSAVQEMRQKAQQAGNLKTNQQENVQEDNGQIDIAPANPDVVYVPEYDPWLVYGYPITPWPYWVSVPGIWWGGPGLYWGVGFPIAPFFGFGWGWHAWGVDWFHHGFYFNHAPYYAHGPAFFNRGAYYGGRPGYGHPGTFHGALPGRDNYRGYAAPRGGAGTRSGAFSGVDRGGTTRGFSARGQGSAGGGFHGGGFHGGGFHGGGGHR
jgi:hypothetical protein